jgi:hypothetical protein
MTGNRNFIIKKSNRKDDVSLFNNGTTACFID